MAAPRRTTEQDQEPDHADQGKALQSRDQGSAEVAALLPFVQFLFPGTIGPDDGSYMVRGGATPERERRVVTFATAGAPAPQARRKFARRSKIKRSIGGEAQVTVGAGLPSTRTRVTVVGSEPFESLAAANEWLKLQMRDADARDHAVDLALADINQIVATHRIAAGDPYVIEVDRRTPLNAHLGFGSGEALAAGSCMEAVPVPQPRTKRAKRIEILHPQARVAAILAGREQSLVAEELLLRTRLDLEQNRPRQAALQLDIALEALLRERERLLACDEGESASRNDNSATHKSHLEAQRRDLEELARCETAVEHAADAALRGDLDRDAVDHVTESLERAERVLRRWRFGLN